MPPPLGDPRPLDVLHPACLLAAPCFLLPCVLIVLLPPTCLDVT